MQSLPRGPHLSESEFTILRDLIHDQTGLFYENGKRTLLAEKLAGRLLEKQLRAFVDYYYLLRFGPGADEEWKHVLDALSVQETYFWREMDQIRVFVDEIVPAHFATEDAPLKIWSAACATGEEPLSIAMALDQKGWFERAPIEITASDGSQSALTKARTGSYRERAFRALPESLREKYFTPACGGWQIDPGLHRRVRFCSANLSNEGDVSALLPAHVIFCRNAFIYFSEKSIVRVLRGFFDGLTDPGYLFVGVSESLLRFSHGFALQDMGNSFVYVKRSIEKAT